LSEVAHARSKIGCQSRSAWYRGLNDNDYDLTPSLFRRSASVSGLIADLDDSQTLNQLRKSPNNCKDLLRKFVDSGALSVQYAKYTENGIDNALKRQGAQRDLSLKNFLGSVPGERDAFHEFFNRSRGTVETSWSVLANMRHHGVPTRLLDWSDSFIVSMYFALEHYTAELVPFWREVRSWKGEFPPFLLPKGRKSPGLWLLNPFHLAEEAGIIGLIPYPDHSPIPDYYQTFFHDNLWPYQKPIPLHAPKNIQRMESQRGHFTVHGFDERSLNHQLRKSNSVLVNVPMTDWAAIYGTYFLWRYGNLDRYELYRDLDSLGNVVSGRHFGNNPVIGWAYFARPASNELHRFADIVGTKRLVPRPGDRLVVKSEFYLRQSPYLGRQSSEWSSKPKIGIIKKGTTCLVLQVVREGQMLCLQLSEL
jgi:hypothetical protein